jgi:transketolase
MDTPALVKIASRLRYLILSITDPVKSGHPTTCFSAIELMTTLFFRYLKYDLDNPQNPTNDRVIFSKGHASALLYSLLAVAGKINTEELKTYRLFQSPLEGHPTYRFPFAEAATGSLGQGLSIAAGEAWALRRRFKILDLRFKNDPPAETDDNGEIDKR